MVEVVRALDELGLVGLDGQLHLHYHFASVEQVHEDVLVSLVEPVLDPDDFDARIRLSVSSLNFLVKGDDLVFF